MVKHGSRFVTFQLVPLNCDFEERIYLRGQQFRARGIVQNGVINSALGRSYCTFSLDGIWIITLHVISMTLYPKQLTVD